MEKTNQYIIFVTVIIILAAAGVVYASWDKPTWSGGTLSYDSGDGSVNLSTWAVANNDEGQSQAFYPMILIEKDNGGWLPYGGHSNNADTRSLTSADFASIPNVCGLSTDQQNGLYISRSATIGGVSSYCNQSPFAYWCTGSSDPCGWCPGETWNGFPTGESVKVYIDFEPGDYRATFIGFARDDTDINASCADGGGHFSPFFGSAITFNIGGGIVPGPGPGPGPGGDIFVRVTRINQCGSRTEDVCVLEAVVESSSTDTKYVLFRDGDGNLIGKGTNIEGAENGVSTLVLDQCLKGEEDGDPITYNITAIPYIVF